MIKKYLTIPLVLSVAVFCFVFVPVVLADYSQTQYSDECKDANINDFSTFFCMVGHQMFNTVNPPPNLPKTGMLSSITLKLHSRSKEPGYIHPYERMYFWRKTNSELYCYFTGFSIPNDDKWHDITIPILPNAQDGFENRGTDNCILDFSKDKLIYIYGNNYALDMAWSNTNVYEDTENNYQGMDLGSRDKSLYFKINDESFKFTTPQNNETINKSSYTVTGTCPVDGVKQLAVTVQNPVSSFEETGFNTDCEQGAFSYTLPLNNDVRRIYVTDKTTGSIIFAPVVVEHISKTPVLIVPGIAGTKLFEGNDELWPDLSEMFGDVGDDFLVEKLVMDENGVQKNNIDAKEVIKVIDLAVPGFDKHYFDNLEKDLKTSGYEDNKDLFYFPYDWRNDLNSTTALLKVKIEEIKQQTGSSKVDIIAHSMGGLLTKTYIREYGNESINKLIFVGTPHLGAPKAFRVLREGDNFSIPWLRNSAIKKIAQNMPSVYQLLPQKKYFEKFQPYLQTFNKNTINQDFNYFESLSFLVNLGFNGRMVSILPDNMSDTSQTNFLDYGNIKIYNIVGCKSSTEAKYVINEKKNTIYSIGFTSGDGTVPFESADNILTPAQNKFYFRKADHAQMPSAEKVRKNIINILTEEEIEIDKDFANSTEFCGIEGKQLSWFSPVEVHIYDALNNHMGPVGESLEFGIDGASYTIADGHKFIFLPTDEGQEYSIQAKGLDIGTFDLRVEKNENGIITGAQIFNDVKITSQSKVNFLVNESVDNNEIQLDYEGEGNYVPVQASAVLSGDISQDFLPPVTTSSSTQANINNWWNKDVLVSLPAVDEESGILETKYSLDGGEFVVYAQPIIITKEGETILRYYSVDKAGNNEEIIEKIIKIDKTPPEFSAVFDVAKKDLVFSGTDNLTKPEEVQVLDSNNKVKFTDLAGNITEITLKQKDRKKSLSAELLSLSYNGKLADITKNRFSFSWAYDKKGSLKVLIQHVLTSKNFSLVSAIFDGRNTRVLNLNQGIKPETKTYKGLKLINIKSNQGKLLWEIK